MVNTGSRAPRARETVAALDVIGTSLPASPNSLELPFRGFRDTASGSHEERRTPRGAIRVIGEIRVIAVPPVDAREPRRTVAARGPATAAVLP